MTKSATARRLRAGLAAFAASALAGLGASAQTLAQPSQTALEASAANYVRYRSDVDYVKSAGFNGPADIREAHKRLAGHDAQAFADGWIAYAALVAADTPAFADGMRKVAGKKKSRADFVARLNADPRAPASVPGAREAVEQVLIMAARDARAFAALGATFQEQAYAMQKTSWGETKLAASAGERIAEAKAYRASRGAARTGALSPSQNRGVVAPSLASADADWTPAWSTAAVGAPQKDANAETTIDRVMYLATRYALGDLTPELVTTFGKNTRGGRCVKLAQANLDACISATNAPFEEAFCIGNHALNDISECVGGVVQ